MSEMVERVARALAAHDLEGALRSGQLANRGSAHELAIAATSAVDDLWSDYVSQARAAIEAMKEPTSEQATRMETLLGLDSPPTRRWHWVWEEMIDTALKDPK